MFEPRPDQVEPAGDWRVWLYRAGRGAGKTALGAYTMSRWVHRTFWAEGPISFLIGAQDPTFQAERIIDMSPHGFVPTIERQLDGRHELHWPGGRVGLLRRGDDPEGFEGFTGHAWLDELFHWPRAAACFDGLAKAAKVLITATPREGDPLILRILAEPGTHDSRVSTTDNAALDPRYLARMTAVVASNPLLDPLQELEGQILSASGEVLDG